MAEKLLLYYKYIRELQGAQGQIRLAQLTKMPSIKAALEEDTPRNIKLFRDAVQKLTGQEAPIYDTGTDKS